RLPAARARPPSPRGASGGRDRGASAAPRCSASSGPKDRVRTSADRTRPSGDVVAKGEGSRRARPAKGPRGAGRRRARQSENSEISANEEKTPRRLGPRAQAKNPPRPRIEDSYKGIVTRIRRFQPLSRRPRRRHAQARGAGASESPRPRRGRALEWVSLFPLPFQAPREARSESLREKHRGDTDFLERKKTRRRRTMHRPRRRLETRRTAPSPSLLPLEKVAGPDPRRAASRRAAFSPPGLPASRAPLPSALIRASDRGSRAAARAGPSRRSRRSRGSPRLSSAARRSPTSPADRDAAGFAGGSSAPTRPGAARGDSPREGPRAAGVHRGRAPSSARNDARGALPASRT